MRTRTIVIAGGVLAAVALAWTLRLHEPHAVDERSPPASSVETPAPAARPEQPNAAPSPINDASPVSTEERARFNEQAREFFARAPALPPDEARQRAEQLSQELTRIEQAGGLSAGEIFLVRAGLIRATEPDERKQAAQLRALKQRYEAASGRRGSEPDPMFQLYKVRESEIVAEVMALQTIPDGLSRDEYLRRRLQAAREQLLDAN